jgi:SAM-dependent methyltransferase
MSTTDDASAFSRRIVQILNDGALNLALGIGYRLGLFEALDTLDAPCPAGEIAATAKLDERYVAEWLGVVATGGIVEVTPAPDGGDLFRLPKAHGDLLCRRAGSDNLGVYTQEIPLLTDAALEAVCQGFSTGQGVAYEHYPRFQAFMGELAAAKHRKVLVGTFLPSVDGGRLVDRLERGITVCDLGCGEGVALNLMAQAFPSSRFVGIDINDDGLTAGRREAAGLNLDNVAFVKADAAQLVDDPHRQEAYDYITAFDAVHDQTRPLAVLRGVQAMLKPDGLFSMVDVAAASAIYDNRHHPMGPFLYTVSLMHCMPVGLAHGGMGLGMMWGRHRALDLLHQAGFGRVAVHEIPDDPFNLHYECRK